jgi:hypothetical protein
MSPTLLMRECAELRRLLGQVLGMLAERQAAALTSGQRATVLTALEDAAEWRELLAGEWRDKRGELLAQAEAYRDLARQIGGQR